MTRPPPPPPAIQEPARTLLRSKVRLQLQLDALVLREVLTPREAARLLNSCELYVLESISMVLPRQSWQEMPD